METTTLNPVAEPPGRAVQATVSTELSPACIGVKKGRRNESSEALARQAAGFSVDRIVPRGTVVNSLSHLPSAICHLPSLVQPTQDVRGYLKTRRPQPHFSAEPGLWMKVPKSLRDDVEALIGRKPGEGFFAFVDLFLKHGESNGRTGSVWGACRQALALAKNRWPLKTFRRKYDAYAKAGDWVVLVNKTEAGAEWQDTSVGLPDAFINDACAPYCARFARGDTKAEVIRVLKRWWKTGKDVDDVARPMPGYEHGWNERNTKLLPDGWHPTNIRRQIKERRAFTEIDRALTHEGIAAAKEFLPQVEGTASDLLFMEEVTFDDVRTDILIIDPETGKHCELWLLVARSKGQRLVLGFVEHLSVSRDDGTDSHLGQKEMKQLSAWLLERYHLPPYPIVWRVERGTATLTENSARCLQELLGGRITVKWTSMIGGRSPVGYAEKAKGNSRGKGSHEAKNRSFHISASFLPGQTGAHYGIRPADLNARVKENLEIWEMRQRLPAHQRGKEKYSLLTPREARKHFNAFALQQNFDTGHSYEGFEERVDWYDPRVKDWRPQSEYNPSELTPAEAAQVRFQPRKESPVERAIRLIEPYAKDWQRVSPDIIVAFLGNEHRKIKSVSPAGIIEISIAGQKIKFHPPQTESVGQTGSVFCIPHSAFKNALGYYATEDPAFLHVTDGDGRVLGTWYRRDRVSGKDETALQAAIHYTASALKTAQAHAAALCAPQRAQLEAMRAHNAELERGNDFIDIGEQSLPPALIHGQTGSVHGQTGSVPSTLNSPVAAAIASLPRVRKQREDTQSADQALADSLDSI